MSSPILNTTISDLDDFSISSDTVTIDTSVLNSHIIGPYPSYNIGVGAIGSNGSHYSTNYSNNWATLSASKPGTLSVTGDAEFEGKVKINGQDLAEFMETLSKRLAILVPDPAKLEHFEALKKAYNHYKTLEALCELPIKENKE